MLRLIFFLMALLAGTPGPALAAEPPTTPILRIETGHHAAMVRRLVADMPRQRLVTAGDDKTLRIWQLPQGNLLNTLRLPIGDKQEGRPYAIAVTPDGATIAAGGWTGWEWDQKASIYLFNSATGEIQRRISGLPDAIATLNFSPDGRVLAAGLNGAGGVHFYSLANGELISSDHQFNDRVLAADFSTSGTLAAVGFDGFMRIYDANSKLIGRRNLGQGAQPAGVRFSPDGARLLVSFRDRPRLLVLSARDLSAIGEANVKEVPANAVFAQVAWSSGGDYVHVTGDSGGAGVGRIWRWPLNALDRVETLPVSHGRVADIAMLSDGQLAYATEEPAIGILNAAGKPALHLSSPVADFRDSGQALRVSTEGSVVEFPLAGRAMRFSLSERRLEAATSPLAALAPPRLASSAFRIERWRDVEGTLINGVKLALDEYETSRSYAIAPDDRHLILGTEWTLRLFDLQSRQAWALPVVSPAWNVTFSGDGSYVIAALGDGTLRWYRREDGVEVMAVFIHGAGEEWIAFTPAGYYLSSNYGDNFVGWHLNRGKDKSADFFRAVQFERILYRPDVVEAALSSRGRAPIFAARDAETFNIRDLALIAPPRIRIGDMSSFTAPDGTARLKVAFEVEKNSLPMRDYAVYVNNIPVTPAKERRLGAREAERFAREIELDLQVRDNVVRIEVANGRSVGLAEKPFSLQGTTIARQAPGELYLLAIGANHFNFLVGADLAFAARDAEQVERFFAANNGKHYSKVNTRILSDLSPVKPERAKIIEALQFLSAAGPRDTVIIFLASHGISDAAGNYYFVTRDASAEDVEAVLSGAERNITSLVGWSAFFEALRGVAGRRLLIVDTCQAKNIEGKLDVHSLSKRSASSLFSLVVASKGNEESQEYAPGEHGLFTYAMLNGLRGAGDANRDGVITLNEMFRAAAPVVDQLRNKEAGQQTPQIMAPEPLGDMVLVRTSGTAMSAQATPMPVNDAVCGVRTLVVGARDPRCSAEFGGRDTAPQRPVNTGCTTRNLVVGARDTNCSP